MNWNDYDAALFDLDGVITPTADVHRRAWATMFTAYFTDKDIAPPYTEDDYFQYLDGKPRYDGVRSLLASRGVTLPEGTLADPSAADTVCGLGNRKNDVFSHILDTDGVAAYPGSLALLDVLEARGTHTAIVSSSRNAPAVLKAAGIFERFEIVVDGMVVEEQGVAGKPAPDMFELAARELGVPKERAVVFEDALSGVQAGRAGAFGLVVGVDRGAGADELRQHGADVVVADLAELVTA